MVYLSLYDRLISMTFVVDILMAFLILIISKQVLCAMMRFALAFLFSKIVCAWLVMLFWLPLSFEKFI
jgi:hypothetical protein